MCHFITATLPKGTNLEAAATVFDQFKLGFKVIHNQHLESQIPEGEHYILTTRGHCDCGTVIGSLHRNTGNDSPYSERDLKKFRKLGWSEAKIKRWLEEKESARKTAEIKAQTFTENEESQASFWVGFLTAALKSDHINRIGLLLHLYTKGVTNEKIKLKNTVLMPIKQLRAEDLLNIEEDTLYQFI